MPKTRPEIDFSFTEREISTAICQMTQKYLPSHRVMAIDPDRIRRSGQVIIQTPDGKLEGKPYTIQGRSLLFLNHRYTPRRMYLNTPARRFIWGMLRGQESFHHVFDITDKMSDKEQAKDIYQLASSIHGLNEAVRRIL